MSLEINPNDELIFQGTCDEVCNANLNLTNRGTERLAFKIKTACEHHRIKPYKGFIDLKEAVDVQVTYKPQANIDSQQVNKQNRLVIKYLVVPKTYNDEFDTFWKEYGTQTDDTQQVILQCRFVSIPTTPALPATPKLPASTSAKNTVVQQNSANLIRPILKPAIQSPPISPYVLPSQVPQQTVIQQSWQDACDYDLRERYTPKKSRFKSLFRRNKKSVRTRSIPTKTPLIPPQVAPIPPRTAPVPPRTIPNPLLVLPLLYTSNETSESDEDDQSNIKIRSGNLMFTNTDVIVVSRSSAYLLENILKAVGQSFRDEYDMKLRRDPDASLISIRTRDELPAKRVYFVSCQLGSDQVQAGLSIKNLITEAMKRASNDGYQSIAFPAIGCGLAGCSSSFVAKTMVGEIYNQLKTYSLTILFVIEFGKYDIFDQFNKAIKSIPQVEESDTEMKQILIDVGNSVVIVEKGDILQQTTDVIVGTTTSNRLKKSMLEAAGDETMSAYEHEYQRDPNRNLISVPGGQLSVHQIYFFQWEPSRNLALLRKSYMDLISTVLQHVITDGFTSIAVPIIGCGEYSYSTSQVAKMMLADVKNQLTNSDSSLIVKFIIRHEQKDIYDIFRDQMSIISDVTDAATLDWLDHGTSAPIHSTVGFNFSLPSTWECGRDGQNSFTLDVSSDEYNEVLSKFQPTMLGSYSKIMRIERIQNERCYLQFKIHRQGLREELKTDTEKVLFHGCPEQASQSIIKHGFNRNFAGVNGTQYGLGVYFSDNGSYSHFYAKSNAVGERRMFLARVLIGKSCLGHASQKTPPDGYHSTTDGIQIFVTYHDAQAYAEYLIVYQ
ncbi:unnamed protein product [Adineta ricciae]|uniref:Poly [ADP-ribose] polymerase n=1 Tax=Adineta ricciae TaxID=249248 RepID=A0A813TA89_ADIRI|nr:unnamed protein product [Adineta ricciae]CAF1474217.1 unnamed protein product [Adineta ricciae]